MGVLNDIGEAIRKLLKSNKVKPIKKTEIVNMIENNQIGLAQLMDFFDNNGDLCTSIKNDIFTMPGSNPVASHYHKYIAAINNVAKRAESNKFLGSIHTVVERAAKDHVLMLDKFKSLFDDGTDQTEITPEQIRISHTAYLGYLSSINTLIMYTTYMISIINDTTRIPGYRIKYIEDNLNTVVQLVNTITLRGNSQNIITDVQEITKGGNTLVYNDEVSTEVFAEAALAAVTFISSHWGTITALGTLVYIAVVGPRNIILWFGESWAEWNRAVYERNKALREWMITKVALLRMQAEGMDTSSPEYIKLQQILTKYSEIIANYDKKIAEYENG